MDGDSTISIIKLARKVEEKGIGYPDSSHCGVIVHLVLKASMRTVVDNSVKKLVVGSTSVGNELLGIQEYRECYPIAVPFS